MRRRLTTWPAGSARRWRAGVFFSYWTTVNTSGGRVADIVEQLVGDADRIAVLATSREPLRVDGERAVRVNPLANSGSGRGGRAAADRSHGCRLSTG